MRHNYHLDGYAYRLRPVDLGDAAFIVEMRGHDSERLQYIPLVPADEEKQQEWLVRYFEKPDDYYWIVERITTGKAEGLISIYDVSPPEPTAEWGRWVLQPGSLAAVESALLVYRAAFEQFRLRSDSCLTVADNQRVLSFHDSCGLARVAYLKAHFQLRDGFHDAVKHLCTSTDWPLINNLLEPQAQLVARRINRVQ